MTKNFFILAISLLIGTGFLGAKVNYYIAAKSALSQNYYKVRSRERARFDSYALPLSTQQLLRKVDAAHHYLNQLPPSVTQATAEQKLDELFLALDSLESVYGDYVTRYATPHALHILDQRAGAHCYELVGECARSYNMSTPLILLADDEHFMVAASAGINTDASVLLLGVGLLKTVTTPQLKAVINHELAHIADEHIANRVALSLLLTLLLSLLFIALFAHRAYRQRYFTWEFKSVGMFVGLLVFAWYGLTGVPMFTRLAMSYYSRWCEYGADHFAAQRDGDMYGALAVLASAQQRQDAAGEYGYEYVRMQVNRLQPAWAQAYLHRLVNHHQQQSLRARVQSRYDHPTFAQRQSALKGNKAA